MENVKKARNYALIACVLALLSACTYPIIFIKWIVPLYAVSIVLLAAVALLLFLAYFTMSSKTSRPLRPALIVTVVYVALLMGITPLVNNVLCGGVAPWGSTLTNAVLNTCFWLIMLRKIRKKTGEKLPGKPLLCVLMVLVGFVVSIAETIPNMKANGFIVWDTVKGYRERMDTIDIYENTLDTAVPQTQVYDLVQAHLNAPLPAGKTTKKVLVLGWDGCRADAMALKDKRAAADALLADGGKAYIAYCGGANYPAPLKQVTATIEGWTTMFTGRWADGHGISGFDDVNTSKLHTFFTTDIEAGLIDSSAFCYSWSGHNTTYGEEIGYDKANGLNVAWSFTDAEEGSDDDAGDKGTLQKALAHVQTPDCPDLIFTIFEYCDYYGHTYGFWGETPEYIEAFKKSNDAGVELINAVKARPTYAEEDWLILISSDHGGYVRGHGGDTLMERMMFIVTSKPDLLQ